MVATPAYTPFLRLETLIGSQVVESINQYNQVAGFVFANTQMDVSQKYGQQASLGFYDANSVPTLEQLDGRSCSANEVGTFPAPLVGLLSSSAKLIPAFAMPSISVQLTMDSIEICLHLLLHLQFQLLLFYQMLNYVTTCSISAEMWNPQY